MCCVEQIFQGSQTSMEAQQAARVVKSGGHSYCAEWDGKRITALILTVSATVFLIFALVLASGAVGGGKIDFIAGGLTIGSMFFYALAAYLYFSDPEDEP